MKKDLWSYLDNPFNNVTKGNFKRMIMMVQDHRDKLKRAANLDPALMSLFNVLDPAYTQFSAAYQHNKIVQQRREMQTGQFELLMTKMPAMTQEWDYQVIEKYRPSTPEYQFLMSEGRTGLYKLAYELRLSAVSDFIRKLQDFPSLSSLLNEVTAWYQNAMFVRETQQGYEGELQQAQTSVEQARQNLAQKMHYVWAGLLMHYIQEPERVENFYELKYLQRGNSTTKTTENTDVTDNFTTIAAGEKKVVSTGNYMRDTNILITNSSNATMRVWVSNNADSLCPEDAMDILPNSSVSAFGDELTDGTDPLRYIMAENISSDITGKLRVSIE